MRGTHLLLIIKAHVNIQLSISIDRLNFYDIPGWLDITQHEKNEADHLISLG